METMEALLDLLPVVFAFVAHAAFAVATLVHDFSDAQP
jgi:hypothetical protein